MPPLGFIFGVETRSCEALELSVKFRVSLVEGVFSDPMLV